MHTQIEDRQGHVLCPDEKCKQEIMVEDFKQLLGKNLFEAYIKNSLESYVDQHADEVSYILGWNTLVGAQQKGMKFTKTYQTSHKKRKWIFNFCEKWLIFEK